MSKNPYDYSSHHKSSYQSLPPIRDVFGDVLEQPVQTRSIPATSGAYSSRHHTQETYHNDRRSYTGPDQPSPLRSRSTAPTPPRFSQAMTTPRSISNPQQNSSQNPHPRAPPRESFGTSNHSYDVFVSTSSQGLVHQRSSRNDDFRQSAKEEAISTSTGKHACPECGRRFEKLSHFKNHMNSHSGEKPYQCPWPGCGKTFSASSNMRRHERGHGGHADHSDTRRK